MRVAIALGSNLGDREATLRAAVGAISVVLGNVALSGFYDTAPYEVADSQPRYLNAALTGTTLLSPRALLDAMHAIERQFGRQRPFANAPRTLDLDLILYGREILNEPDLSVPHLRFRERRFVLDPLAEVGGEMVDPITGLTVQALREALVKSRKTEATDYADLADSRKVTGSD
jgi:2-amino-4-hydroxy-6-hydroxymethyldihydropteridine diphosphokinase